jgi:isopenicillin N synthase-like dioxygenase
MQSVLRVDLADFRSPDAARRRRFARTFARGLEESGFVRVVGHGVPHALLEATEKHFAALFALGEDALASCAGIAGGQRGYTPFGVEHAKDDPTPDRKRFFHVGQEHPPPGADAADYPANVWPEAVPELRDAALALYRALERCAGTLLEAIAQTWSLPPDRLASMLVGGNSILRALHYPPFDPAPGDLPTVRAAPHEDINLVTLLCATREPGLEILGRDGVWVPVDARPGEIIADAGDMLARVSNGRIPATTHRVVAYAEDAARDRHALPFFAHPRPECDLSVIDAFLEPGEAPRWPPIAAGRFLAQRLREIGLIS